ncbi:Glutamate/phenylalanine/leucine/valine dehydrogenase [Dactylonectria estremocensis]|uniref:NADP-specific glutamate dehydrogenase n=1 Tax=Dactylonectria estremocensis TaxID=1079267 RepID=A0A9P9J880_9HYPO|nr:Glutamate/phenylalanine/leucine/valine dehydrogenase [Dactylonectria estremocensis]
MSDHQGCADYVEYVEQMIKHRSQGRESLEGKRVAISGSGNVATHAAIKVIQLGSMVISLSDSKSSLIATSEEASIGLDAVRQVMEIKAKRRQMPGTRPWKHVNRVDVVLPCATQNELSGEEAQVLIEAGCKYVAEGSNMGCTAEAAALFESHRKSHHHDNAVWFAPGKAANAGGRGCQWTRAISELLA